MAILRHSRIALTMEIYAEVPDKAARDALGKLPNCVAVRTCGRTVPRIGSDPWPAVESRGLELPDPLLAK